MKKLGLVFLLAAGCGGGSSAADAGGEVDAGPIVLRGECPMSDRVGAFDIAHRELYSAVTGQVADGVNPITVLEPAESEGSCQLWRKVNPFCDPPCGPGEICMPGGTCEALPVTRSAGTVTVTGLSKPLSMEPDAVNGYQDTTVDHPPFSEGAEIRLHTSGGDLEPFALGAFGVAPLVVSESDWTISRGESLSIAWTPGGSADATIRATFNVDQHGNTPVTMICDLPDTGSAEIPAALIDTLLDYGISGAASANLFRRTVDSTEIAAGCVELRVLSHVRGTLTVAAP